MPDRAYTSYARRWSAPCTTHRSPARRPLSSAGQQVSASDQVCIVEVMKLMNAINAGQAGVVSEILVSDGQTVEAAQELFVITLA